MEFLNKVTDLLFYRMGTFEDDKEINPWDVSNLEEFLFFCCPECDSKHPSKSSFINHALIEHPKVSRLKCSPSIVLNLHMVLELFFRMVF